MTPIRLSMTYGAECWSIKKQHSLEDLGVALIGDKLANTRLRWLENVQSRPAMTLMWENSSVQADGLSKKMTTSMKVSMIDMKKCNVDQDRPKWRNKVHVDPTQLGQSFDDDDDESVLCELEVERILLYGWKFSSKAILARSIFN